MLNLTELTVRLFCQVYGFELPEVYENGRLAIDAIDCPQQKDGSSCGYWVLAYTEAIISQLWDLTSELVTATNDPRQFYLDGILADEELWSDAQDKETIIRQTRDEAEAIRVSGTNRKWIANTDEGFDVNVDGDEDEGKEFNVKVDDDVDVFANSDAEAEPPSLEDTKKVQERIAGYRLPKHFTPH